ncbi:MAG: LemA family protein [Rhodospirillales bacterium]|nr:MAG: LemA family protein [Rhodospirillales bacterium]
MRYPVDVDQIIGIALALGIFLAVIVAWLVVTGRRLERDWQLVESHWQTLRARLKDRGDLLPELARVTQHRLARQRESLEILARLRTKSISGRNPAERAVAEVELEAVLQRVLAAAMADPGLAGVTEFETIRGGLEDATAGIRRSAAIYNDAVASYMRATTRFPARLLSRRKATTRAEFFDDGRGSFFDAAKEERLVDTADGRSPAR